MLYLQRDRLSDAITQHPCPHETALALSGVKRSFSHRVPTTDLIPDNVFAALATKCIEYLEHRSSKILDGLTAANKIRDASPHYTKQAVVDARTMAAKSAGYKGMMHLKHECISLRTACYAIIAMFSGLRDSEMMSLETDCVRQDIAGDIEIQIFWLHGSIYKTGFRKKKWLVPSIVNSAISILTKLTSKLRDKMNVQTKELSAMRRQCGISIAEEKYLLLLMTQKNKLFVSEATKFGNAVSVLSGKELNHNLKNFCAEHCILGIDQQPYPLHSHQFRRSYARNLARAELGDLMTLKEHFGHWSMDMTAYYTHGAVDELESDNELLQLVGSEKSIRQNEIVADWINTDKPLANGSKWLDEWRRTVRTAKNKQELIKRYAGTISLNGTGHSWCVGNAHGMSCGGLCVFEATLCVDCKYGVIGPEHKAVWTGIRDQQNEVIELDDIGPGGKARAKKIHSIAENVLRRLERDTKND